ncbi:MAG: hypothetical protein SRB2_02533 [Desulfobacteraceae bacterium Eth-SRB2]|nr:MAG: hypothetical protein SRB2_02533 [Desulfobacteraceae bacterium Eth-SRB2]
MRKLLSLIFVFLLLAPFGLQVTGLNFSTHVHKLGIKPPRLSRQAFLDNDYYRSFDQYFNDSFSLRGPLILAKNWLDYHLFSSTDSCEVHIGSDGWLYDFKSIKDYRKEACDHEAYAKQLVLELHALEKIIEASGRRFFFSIAPSKATIYPEFVGFVSKGDPCDSSLYDLFLKNITLHPMKSFVRLDALLKDEKKKGALLYNKTNTRWNRLGAMVAAKTIFKEVLDGRGEAPSIDLAPFEPMVSGDLTGKLMGLSVVGEEKLIRHFRRFDRAGLPSAVVYGDFFMSNLIHCLAEKFTKLDMISTDCIPSRKHGENLKSYGVILIERAESEMETMHIEIDRIFSELETQELSLNRRRLDLKDVLPVSQISLKARVDGMAIKSVGSDSIFKFISVPGSNHGTFRVLKLSIESPRPDIMTIEYMADPPHMIQKPLKTGATKVYLPLPFGDSLCLRINPGKTVGFFMLRSAEIFEFSNNPDGMCPVGETPVMAMTGPEDGDTCPHRGGNTDRVIPDTDTVLPVAVKTRRHTDKTSGEIMPQVVKEFSGEKSSIAVTDYEDGRIFQRRGDSGDIVVSGTYTGMPVPVEARVVRYGTSEEIVPWSVVDECPKNGIFLGKLAGIPQGGWYNIQTRNSKNHDISSRGSHRWAVGILVGCIGQSNMKEWFHTGTNATSHSLIRKHTHKGWSELGMKGNAAIAFGNRLIERLSIPIGLLDYSVNGSGLRKEADWGMGYWENTRPGSIYNRFLSGVSAVGGDLEYVIWMQGEADAARGTVTEVEYRASLESFITHQVRADIDNGSNQANLPFFIVMMIKRPGGKDGPHQAIRNAQKHVAENVPDCYPAATTLDLENHGRQHLAPDAYTTLGLRVAQTVLYILGKEKYYRGPRVAAVNSVDSRTLDVTIQHCSGTDFTPVHGISGWEVLAGETLLPVSKVYRRDAETIRIILKNTLACDPKIRYLYGAMPDTTRPVLDNTALALPLEEYH